MAGYVSEAVIKRLPAYYRHLKELEKEGIHQISSQGPHPRFVRTSTASVDLAGRDMAIPSAACASTSATFWAWTARTA